MSKNTAERVIKIVAEYKEMPESKIKPETTLDELEMDSLDALNLVFELEEGFDIEIPDEKAFEMKTINEMIEGIDKLQELKKSGKTVESAEAEEAAKTAKTKEAEEATEVKEAAKADSSATEG